MTDPKKLFPEDISDELRKARHLMFLYTGGFIIGGGFTERTLTFKSTPLPVNDRAWDVYRNPWAWKYVADENIFVDYSDKHSWLDADRVEGLRMYFLGLAREAVQNSVVIDGFIMQVIGGW